MFDQDNTQSTNPAADSTYQAATPDPSNGGLDTTAPVTAADSPFAPAQVPDDTPSPTPVSTPASPTTDDLLTIKQDALQELSPLVGHLDQEPEDKFRTTMMMIQASDDQSLLKSAYETAKQITDEKVRAQALLDVVNEINYFTQHHGS